MFTILLPISTSMLLLKNFIEIVQNEDICFKCKSKIKIVEELSIEHKLPWEGISIELFWDLDNIAFSHLK